MNHKLRSSRRKEAHSPSSKLAGHERPRSRIPFMLFFASSEDRRPELPNRGRIGPCGANGSTAARVGCTNVFQAKRKQRIRNEFSSLSHGWHLVSCVVDSESDEI